MAYRLTNWPRPENRRTVNAVNGYNTDIIEAIHVAFFRAVTDVAGTAQQFKGSTRLASAFNVWRFLREKVKYQKDPDALQMVKLPARLIAEGAGDCKSLSITAGALLKNLGFPVVFRYVSYSGNPTPTHVYIITFDKTGAPIIVDAVYKQFNKEVPFRSKRDYLMKLKSR